MEENSNFSMQQEVGGQGRGRRRRRQVLVAGAVAASLLTVSVATYASENPYEGYEALKDWMKTSQGCTLAQDGAINATFSGRTALLDNGSVVFRIDGTAMQDEASGMTSGDVSIEADGWDREVSFYRNGEDSHVVDQTNGLAYRVVNAEPETDGTEGDSECGSRFDSDEPMTPAQEALLDALMGDLKEQVEMVAGDDGSRTFSMDLTAEEIPVFLQLVAAVAEEGQAGNASRFDEVGTDGEQEMDAEALEVMGQYPFFDGMEKLESLESRMPELENMEISHLSLSLTVQQDGAPSELAADIAFTGTDAEGATHEMTLSSELSVSGVGETQPAAFEANGMEVGELDASEFRALESDFRMEH